MRVMALVVGILLTWVPGSIAKELQFPEIAGWKKSAEIQTFIPKTLYEYINGAADLYLASDFEELKVAEYGNEKKASIAALKWVLQNPNLHTIVAGFATFDQLEVDLSVMEDINLNESEKKELQKEASLPGLYCQGCRECLGQCVARLPIPDLMRAYMYVYDYRNLGMAQDLVVSLGLLSELCGDCSRCPVRCPSGFDVKVKIRDIVRIHEIPTEYIV